MAQPTAPLPAPVKNGFGTAALVLGIIGLLFAWIPFVGFIGFVLGTLAIVFGGIAVYRAHTRLPGSKVVSYFGLVLGVVAFVVSIATFGAAVNSIDSAVNRSGPAAPPAANQTSGGGEEVTHHAFGGTATWPGGEQIQVSVPKPVSSDNPFLSPSGDKRWVAVDVTVTNGSDRPYSVMSTSFTAQHAGRVAQEAYTSEENDSLPQTELAPGQSVAFTKVFEIEGSSGDLQLSVKPNPFAATTAYFTGTV